MRLFECGKTNPNEMVLRENRAVTSVFSDVAAAAPDRVAIVCGEHQITYGDLERRSNRIARQLRSEGAGTGQVIGLFVPKTIETIAQLLGILKAGAAYLPLDVEMPVSRQLYMISESGIRLLLNAEAGGPELARRLAETCVRGIETEGADAWPDHAVSWRQGMQNLAYVMYTSGSSGHPKGVMIEDRGILRLVLKASYFPIEKGWRLLQGSTLVFDACIFEIFGALLNGAELYMVDADTMLNPARLKSVLADMRIDVLFMTTPLFHQMVDVDARMFEPIRHFLIGGDVMQAEKIRKLRSVNEHTALYNVYGPTENTAYSTIYRIPDEVPDPVPIGRAISYSTAYIAWTGDEEPAPDDVGELYVGGEGVARGYINNEKLTDDCFVRRPGTGERLYKTGDLIRRRSDGCIEFVGRADSQIKIRGYRIEIDDIRRALCTLPDVRDCAVLCEADGDEKRLDAYVILNKPAETQLVFAALKTILPPYMLPNTITAIEAFPLNLNGKIDAGRLRVRRQVPGCGAEPVCDVGAAGILKEQLQRTVGPDDDLYAVGFNSITAVKTLAALKKAGFDLGMRELLRVRTLRELAILLDEPSS